MKFIEVDSARTTRLFWSFIAVVGGVLFLTTDQSDPSVFAAAFVLAVVGLFPFYLWLLGWSHGLPLWPVFCLANGVGYAVTMFQNPETLADYAPVEIIVGGMTAAGFVFLGTLLWAAMTSKPPKPPARTIMIEHKQSLKFLMLFLALGILFQLNQMLKWIPFPGNAEMIVRGIALSLATMGLFVLSFYAGRGLLTVGQRWYLGCCALLLIMFGLGSLMLAQAAIPFAMLVLGFTFGGSKIPWKIVGAGLVVIAILHPGKYEMRNKYWAGGAGALHPSNAAAFFGEWIGYGLEEIGGFGGLVQAKTKSEDSSSSAFERAGTLHMLLRVQKMSPTEVPFLNGLTYAHVPRMLIPRIIDDEKGTSHVGNQILSVNYGLVQLERVNTVSIQWGLIPEAYANFGYLGVAALAVVLAVFYSYIGQLTAGVPLTSLRFVIGLLIMAASVTADTMGVFVTTQFQGIMAVSMASLFFMRRQPNPFALKTGEDIRQVAAGTESNVGLPSPGFLTSLIEGQQLQVADQETAGQHAGTRQAADGAIVRTMSARLPMRAAAWMPRSMRKRLAAQQELERRSESETKLKETVPPKPRQVAVPYQPYYYRSRKA